MAKSKRYHAKCRQCSNMRECKLWARAINVPSENPWETCGKFNMTTYDPSGKREWEYMHNI